MSQTVTPPTDRRRALMKGVGQRDTDVERILRKSLWHRGLRYRLHQRIAGSTPDLVFPAARVAVYVDGCFWHGCAKHYRAPKKNAVFWARKISANRERDRRHNANLAAAGWNVFRFWGCDVSADPEELVTLVERAVRGHGSG